MTTHARSGYIWLKKLEPKDQFMKQKPERLIHHRCIMKQGHDRSKLVHNILMNLGYNSVYSGVANL